MSRHPVFDDPLHARQANSQGVLDQLAHSSHPAVPEVVDVVWFTAAVYGDQLAHKVHYIPLRQRPNAQVDVEAESLIQLVASDFAKVVAFGLEECQGDQVLRALRSWQLTRTHPLVNLLERRFLVL